MSLDPKDPFPLEQTTYAKAQQHSALVDEWLGFQTDKAEELARERLLGTADEHQLWLNLPVQAMLTPYSEIRMILSEVRLAPGMKVIDLGAGYGRMGFVMAQHHPENPFTGYEYVRERVVEGTRCLQRFLKTLPGEREKVELLEADLSSPNFTPASADVYFIYDYGTTQAIRKTLDDLRDISTSKKIMVVGRGRASRDAIERDCPWLSQVIAPKHYKQFSIYRSAE